MAYSLEVLAMSKTKRITKNIAKTGARTVGDIIGLILKIIGTVILTVVTTGIVFSFIFMMYLRSNLSYDLDINLEDVQLSLSSVIYAECRETNRLEEQVTIQSPEFRIWVDLDDIPQHMINALIAIEDQRFYQHNGVDWYRTTGAFVNMFLSMRDTFGGSTITQQLIKNLTHEDDVTVQRKLLEIFRALEFERHHSKEEIAEMYLNLVYFGHGAYGVGAAAQLYFAKDVSELSVAESAAIIGITNNPSRFSPYRNQTENRRRQVDILFKMRELGFINEQQYRAALAEEMHFQRGEHTVHHEVVYTWFEEVVIRDVINALMEERGYSEPLARRLVFTGGFRIVSTIDLEMQAIVDNIYENRENLPRVTGSHQPLQSSIIVADPYTGEIRALSGGTGPKRRNLLLNRATQTRRPPGSSIKPISVYAPAMDRGLISPTTRFNDSSAARLTGTNWMPQNFDRRHRGIVDARRALASSLNTTAAQILDLLLPSNSYRFMIDDLGFTSLVPADEDFAPLSMGQLTHGATVREMTSAFTMFPNSGYRTALVSFSRVYDSNGEIILDNRVPQTNRAISEATAYWMTDMLVTSVVNGTGGAAILPNRMPVAGKTGTTTAHQDRWFVGFTPYYVAAVWTGFDTPAPMQVSGNPATQIWRMVMEPIHEGLEPRAFFNELPSAPHIPVVPGIRVATFTIRSVDTNGNLIQESSASAQVNRAHTVTAPAIEGYTLVGASTITLEISEDASRNIAVFTYVAGYSPPPGEYPPDNEPPEVPPEPPIDEPPPPDPPPEPPIDEPPDPPPEPPPEPPVDEPPDSPPQLPPQSPDSGPSLNDPPEQI